MTAPNGGWQRGKAAGSILYLWFVAGFSPLVYAGFVWWSDVRCRSWGSPRVLALKVR